MPARRTMRLFRFVLPQALLLPSGFALGLVWGVVDGAGGWAQALASSGGSSSTVGPAHGGSGLLVVLAAAFAVLALAIASSLTLAGITSALMGAMYGFVLSSSSIGCCCSDVRSPRERSRSSSAGRVAARSE